MTILKQDLATIYKDIRNEVINVLETNENLSEIKDIIYGERKRIGSLKTPAVWIVPNAYNPQFRGGHTAQHDIPFDFVTFVKSHDPQEGLEKAQDLAMKVYDAMVKDRTLNGLVSDVRPTRVDPAYSAGQSTQIYWSAVQFTYRLQRRE